MAEIFPDFHGDDGGGGGGRQFTTLNEVISNESNTTVFVHFQDSRF